MQILALVVKRPLGVRTRKSGGAKGYVLGSWILSTYLRDGVGR